MLDESMSREAMSDVPSTVDRPFLSIDRVGIRNIRHPIRVKDRSGRAQATIASVDMEVGLPAEGRETYMYRLVEMLHRDDRTLSVRSFQGLVPRVLSRLEADACRIEMSFPYFVNKSAPVSGAKSVMDYRVSFIGEANMEGRNTTVQVIVPVTSLCPCSKQISRYGAHNQRSHVTVTATIQEPVWIEDLIELVEHEASCPLYGVLKRADEKFVTERAYDNPKFVEDLVRDVAGRLNADGRVVRYVVEAENFESIHNHSAYAMIESGARG